MAEKTQAAAQIPTLDNVMSTRDEAVRLNTKLTMSRKELAASQRRVYRLEQEADEAENKAVEAKKAYEAHLVAKK